MGKSKIIVVGAGYVGLVAATCFADIGHSVCCVDADSAKVESLKRGKIPIYEPGLEELVSFNSREGRLTFSSSLENLPFVPEVYFIAVGTPIKLTGDADLQYVEAVAKEIGQTAQAQKIVVVNKSTVPVGTASQVKEWVLSAAKQVGKSLQIEVVSNPEFLKEGSAVNDFFRPDRVVLGSQSSSALNTVKSIYSSFMRNNECFVLVGEKEAEMIKYAANAMLATKISFMNEVASICDLVDVDVNQVRKGIATDKRIGPHFIYPGCGYGGSCFPKDVSELAHLAKRNGLESKVLDSVMERNAIQKATLFNKLQILFSGDLSGKKVAIWGLSFKPDTDDMREAPSIPLIESIIEAGGEVVAYDPVAVKNAKASFPHEWVEQGKLTFGSSQYAILHGVDALVLVTEWKCFRYPDWPLIQEQVSHKIVVDGRNQYDPAELDSLGIIYWGVGRANHLCKKRVDGQSKEGIRSLFAKLKTQQLIHS